MASKPLTFPDRVRFEKRGVPADDGYGNEVPGEFATQFERPAEIRPLRGGEQVLAARLQGTQPVLIFVRYDGLTKTVTPDWRAVDDRAGTVYAITTAADMERQRRLITLTAEAGVAA